MSPAATTQRGARTRARILAAAADVVYERGATAASLDDVLAASGAGKSQLYHYFGGKDELIAAVIDHQAERVLDTHRQLLADVTSLAGLRGWADAVVAAQRRAGGIGGCPLGSLVTELADHSEAYRRQLLVGFTRWQRLLADTLYRLADRGELGGGTAPDRRALDDAAAGLLTALQGGLVMSRATHDVRHLQLAMAAALAALAP